MKDILSKENIKRESGEGGFFRILALIIIIVAILAFMGFDSNGIWESFLRPIITSIFDFVILIFDFVVGVVAKAVGVFKSGS